MKPSFHKLYSRGRYSGPGRKSADGETGDQLGVMHEERERFAVAALAFCLKHSTPFREAFLAFLKSKLGVEIRPDSVEFDVEPRHEADLVVRSSPERECYLVVEFKINASLKPHQDPRIKRGFSKRYGRQLQKAKAAGWANVGYIVVWQQSLEEHRDERDGIVTAICHWDELKRSSVTSDSLQRDLFQCLGWLGVNCMKDMKLTELPQANSVCQVHGYFTGILNDDQLRRCVRANGVDASSSADGWHYGLNFSLKEQRPKGWLGYECKGGQPYPSIWFYCENEKQRTLVAKALKTYAESASKEGGWLWYQYPPDSRKSEREWFVDVLNKMTANQRTA